MIWIRVGDNVHISDEDEVITMVVPVVEVADLFEEIKRGDMDHLIGEL